MTSLQFAELSEAYGGVYEKVVEKRKREELVARIKDTFENIIEKKKRDELVFTRLEGDSGPPTYDETTELDFCKDLKPGQKLRVVDGVLKVDKRIIKCVARTFSRDNRHKTLEHLKTLCEKYGNNYELVEAIEKIKVTYKDDKHFLERLNNISVFTDSRTTREWLLEKFITPGITN